MLDVAGSPAFRTCDRVTRRDLLRVGSLVLGGLTLADTLRRRALAGEAGPPGTAVIQLFLGGGPSHLDTFDMKPHAPAEFRGEFSEIATSVAGTRISEHLPRLASAMDKVSVVRSVMHANSSHLPASHWIQTGHDVRLATLGQNANPSSGAIAARLRGANAAGMPAYAAVPRALSFGNAAYLGTEYQPFTTDMDPNDEKFHVRNLSLVEGVSRERFGSRRALLAAMDSLRRDIDARGELLGLDRHYRDAMEMITGTRASEAFDIRREPPHMRERYGRTNIGQNCLLARRLVEAGVTYVTCLSGGDWDTHKDNFKILREFSLPRLDQAVSALVEDLHERGLSDRVLVNVMGEFGRTPRINADAGRDHWPGAMSVLFAGGGLKMGQMVGSTDKYGAYPTSHPYSPGCVLATIYHVLNIDTQHVFYDRSQRPVPVLSEGEPIAELL